MQLKEIDKLRVRGLISQHSFCVSLNTPLPSAFDVRRMHMLRVVGRQVRINNPSRRGAGRKPGKRKSIPFVIGNPTKNGQAPKVIV
jgi:hypothetical protein